VQLTNCHVHTFTHDHVPDRFVPRPLNWLLRIGWFRRLLLKTVLRFDRGRRGRIARFAEILEISFNKTQRDVFETVRGFYSSGTRFVVLPMDMDLMGAGKVAKPIDIQHAELAALRDIYPESVIAFAAVDPRHDGVVEKTIRLIEEQGFLGIKLYPPTGYHPNDPTLWPLYAYAEQHGVPVLTHCSRPASVQYRGKPTDRMRTDPLSGEQLELNRLQLLTLFTDPDTYRPILSKHPRLRICLAHFGGAGDWDRWLDHPWDSDTSTASAKSWLAKIADMLRDGEHPNLWTDIAYTVFADDEHLYLLKVLLSDERILARTLFGSDFYVVADAKLEERRRAVRVRAVLGEELFRIVAEDNPRRFLGTVRPTGEPQLETTTVND
jgi:predicted TIM-barrel fold metal-dependent hydrolase